MDLMSAAGFDMVFIGIETPSEESLAECGKKHNKNRDLIEDIKRIQRHGMQVQGGFIIGFDSDTPSIFQRQIEFIQKSGIVTAMVGLLQAPLGTKLYQRLAQEGRLLGSFSGDNVDGMTNIIPKMNIQVLHKGYETVIRSLYAPAELLCARQDLPARVQAVEDQRAAGLRAHPCILPRHPAARHSGQSAPRVLEVLLLGAVPPSAAVPAGDHVRHLWLPLPTGV